MLKTNQQTLAHSVTLSGTGLHTGKNSNITILPAESNQGITFKRIDLKKNNFIKANYKNVTKATLCTTLENEHGVKVSTVEHLLAALYISEIDNAIIEIDNEEVPIMDGSAFDFLKVFQSTKILKLPQKRKYLKIKNKVELKDGERKIFIEPNEFSLKIDFKLNYKNKVIGNQRNIVDFQLDDLVNVYKSRTFCLLEDVEKIKKLGLAKGGNLQNALVVNEEKVLNDGGLRNEKEFVNHKILDLLGDFLLSGYRVLGKIVCYQGGHELTNLFLRKLLDSKTSYKCIEMQEANISKKVHSNQSIKIAVNA